MKDILVHLDGTERSGVRLKLARDLAVQFEAHLAALHVLDLATPALFMGEGNVYDMRLVDQILKQMRAEGLAAARAIESNFVAESTKNGAQGEWRLAEDENPADAVARHARYVDLVMVGQSNPDEPRADGTRIAETAMLSAGRPVLVVPYAGDFKTLGRKVLVAWKNSREAARAVNDAVPLLKRAMSVTVLTVNPKAGISGDGDVPAADIALHLARHGINATASHAEVDDSVPEGDVLLNSASDLGADLIVTGGYGHSRAREMVFGGVTRTLLSEMTVPVLFSH